MLQVVMVMGLGYSLLVMAFSLNWRVLFHWFLSATAMYMCMIVPDHGGRLRHDQPDGGQWRGRQCADRPCHGRQLLEPSEQLADQDGRERFHDAFGANLQRGRMIYPTRLNDLTSQFTIADPIMKANIEGYLAQCTFYDILLGQGMAGRHWPVRLICSPPSDRARRRARRPGSPLAAAQPRSSAARAPIRRSCRPFRR
jgi:conjugal transfer mating pair stabilization protein TraG